MEDEPRTLTIEFTDGTSLAASMPVQRENWAGRELLNEAIMKSRMFMIELDGELVCVPFENIKHFRVSPVPDPLPPNALRGAKKVG